MCECAARRDGGGRRGVGRLEECVGGYGRKEGRFGIGHGEQEMDGDVRGCVEECRCRTRGEIKNIIRGVPGQSLGDWPGLRGVRVRVCVRVLARVCTGSPSLSIALYSTISLLLTTLVHPLLTPTPSRRLCSLLRPSTNLTTFGSHSSRPFAYSIPYSLSVDAFSFVTLLSPPPCLVTH